MADDKKGLEASEEELLQIRVTVTSNKLKELEATVEEMVKMAKDKDLKVRGPVRMPVKRLKVVTRKAPNGEGTNTWDKFEMKVHKRLVVITATVSHAKQITSANIRPGVDVEIELTQK